LNFFCQPIDQEGLGVVDLEVPNICLLSKWLWKLENSDGPWQKLVRAKYLNRTSVSQCAVKPLDSHFWQGVMKVSPFFYRCCRKKVGNGENTMFWEDVWLGNIPFRERFARLYNLTFSINFMVAKVFKEGWGCIRFRRVLWGETAQLWQMS
jgi:hypothetical protein